MYRVLESLGGCISKCKLLNVIDINPLKKSVLPFVSSGVASHGTTLTYINRPTSLHN